MTRNDVGESIASLNARSDDLVWQVIEPLLRAGGRLRRVPKLKKSYADMGDGPSRGGISDAKVRKLEAAGTIRHVGVDLYELVEVPQ